MVGTETGEHVEIARSVVLEHLANDRLWEDRRELLHDLLHFRIDTSDRGRGTSGRCFSCLKNTTDR